MANPCSHFLLFWFRMTSAASPRYPAAKTMMREPKRLVTEVGTVQGQSNQKPGTSGKQLAPGEKESGETETATRERMKGHFC